MGRVIRSKVGPRRRAAPRRAAPAALPGQPRALPIALRDPGLNPKPPPPALHKPLPPPRPTTG
jgi:hypothetical protein